MKTIEFNLRILPGNQTWKINWSKGKITQEIDNSEKISRNNINN